MTKEITVESLPNTGAGMEPGEQHGGPGNPAPSKKAMWIGRILSGLAVAFLTVDAVMKLFMPPVAVEANAQLGYPGSAMLPIAILELVCLVIYLIPRTAIIGAILWTGYLGGAIAVHVRVGNPLFSHTLFPTYVAALLWAGLWLRDRRVDVLFAEPFSFRPRG